MLSMEGWLTKSPLHGHLFSRDRRRYFTLRGTDLGWFADQKLSKQLNCVSVQGAQAVRQKVDELLLRLAGGEKLLLRGDALDRWEAAFKAANAVGPSGVTLAEKKLLLEYDPAAPAELRSLFESAVEAQRHTGEYAGAEQLFGAGGLHPHSWAISKVQLKAFGEKAMEAMRKGEITSQPDPSKPYYYPQDKFNDPKIGPNMHQVNNGLIKPLTAKHPHLPGASYAVLQNLETCGLLCSLFISHCWDEGVFEFISNALKAWPDECEGAYICFLSNPQVGEVLAKIGLAGGIQTSPFYRVLHEKPRPKLMLMLANGNTPIHTRLCKHARGAPSPRRQTFAPFCPSCQPRHVLTLCLPAAAVVLRCCYMLLCCCFVLRRVCARGRRGARDAARGAAGRRGDAPPIERRA
jgi:hypothetical protein